MKYLRGNSVINSILKSIHEYLKNKRVERHIKMHWSQTSWSAAVVVRFLLPFFYRAPPCRNFLRKPWRPWPRRISSLACWTSSDAMTFGGSGNTVDGNSGRQMLWLARGNRYGGFTSRHCRNMGWDGTGCTDVGYRIWL